MRIEGAPGQRLSEAYLWLTPEEAEELGGALDQMLTAGPDASFHVHISAADYQTEVTLAWEMPS